MSDSSFNFVAHWQTESADNDAKVVEFWKSEGALAVLRDQIPEGIRDLAISLLTSEREGLKQLEATVNILASKIASRLSPLPSQRPVKR